MYAFGLTNALANLQRKMERCMREPDLKERLTFLDDMQFSLKNLEEHLKRLEAVFSMLNQYGLSYIQTL